MKQTRLIMGMPVIVEIVDGNEISAAAEAVFDYFQAVDNRYSTYKQTSEISQINNGLPAAEWSDEMKQVFDLCEQTKEETKGYFDISRGARRDPSGLVKGWAIHRAAGLLRQRGLRDFYIEVGGDIQVSGLNSERQSWKIGIRDPDNRDEIVKTLAVSSEGVATSGTAIRGQHIYNPHGPDASLNDVKSLSVIGPDIYEADRFATAAFAMGREGINFIESRPGLEGYMIDSNRIATFTSNFESYVVV